MRRLFCTDEGIDAIEACTRVLQKHGVITGLPSKKVTSRGYMHLSKTERLIFQEEFEKAFGTDCLFCGEEFNAKDLLNAMDDICCLKCSLESQRKENEKLREEKETLESRIKDSDSWKQALGWKLKYSVFRSYEERTLGRLLSKKCRQLGVHFREAGHQRFNTVRVYHISVAEALADDLLKKLRGSK